MRNKYLFFTNKILGEPVKALDSAADYQGLYEKINIQEISLNKLSEKLDSLLDLSKRTRVENEKTNTALMEQENNFNKIDSLIQKETSIIEKLHTDIDTYKINLDANIDKFKVNKEKLLTMIDFIVDTKNYIKDIELASLNVKNKSNSIFDVSRTIKKIADNNRLLSINAQIESAKSNLTNNGFSVISDEMVKMSDNTRRNSVLIDEIIDEILKDIEKLNESVIFNSKKIEESISLCSIIAEFIESLFEEQSLNIKMFDSILSSMEEMIYYIEETRVCMSAGNYLTAEVFNNTATEYYMIDSLIKESSKYKKELNEIVKNKDMSISNNETINILTRYHRDYSYDPLEYEYEHEVAVCRNIYKTLFVESENGTAMPSIAKGWTDVDKKEWTIYLKDDVFFPNGDRVTAEDVEFSLIRAYNFDKTGIKADLNIIENKVPYSRDKTIVEKLSGIKIVNNRTIKIIVTEPSNSILSTFAAMPSCIISKKEYLKSKKIIGAGAYYIDNIETLPDTSTIVHLKVNPYMSNSVYIKNINLTISKDYDNIIESDEIKNYDIVDKLPYSKLKKLHEDNESYDLHSVNSFAMIFLTFNTRSKNSLMADKGFRQFLLNKLKDVDLAIPNAKEILIRYKAFSTYWYENNVEIGDWLSPGTLKNNKYVFRELNIVTYNGSFNYIVCQSIKDVLEKMNIKVNIHDGDTINISPNYDMAVNLISMGTNSLYTQLYDLMSVPFFADGSISGIKEDLIASKNIVNYNLRIEKQKEIEKRMLQEYCNLPLAYTRSFTLAKNNIISLSNDGLSKLDFGNLIKSS